MAAAEIIVTVHHTNEWKLDVAINTVAVDRILLNPHALDQGIRRSRGSNRLYNDDHLVMIMSRRSRRIDS